MIYLVVSRLKSNHTNVVAAFNDKNLAEVYAGHKQREVGSPFNRFFVQEVPLMDESPEMNRIVLGG